MFTGRLKDFVGGFVTKALLCATLFMPALCRAQPSVAFDHPLEGATFTAGDDISLGAVVTNNSAVITGLDFFVNGTRLGPGQPDPHGEWEYADGSHLSVMHGMFGETMDYSTPTMEFFIIDGQYVTPTVFVGEFTTWVGGNLTTGAATVTLSFTADGKLNVVIDGGAPLAQRTLSAGTRFGEETPFTFSWPSVPAGSYTLEAIAKYGASQTAVSAPIHITVLGGKPYGSDYVRNLTSTPTHDHAWSDTDNQLAVSYSGVHVAWCASATGTNNVSTNRIYYARSQDNGTTFEPWVVIQDRTNTSYTLGSQWLAVDGSTVHIIVISHAEGESGQRLDYYRSTDGGATFEPPQLLGSTAPGENFNRALVAASDGKASIAISFSKDTNTLKFLRSADNGATWQGEGVFSTSVSSIDLAALRQAGNDITLTWDDGEAAGFWFDGAAHVACSSDAGATFTVTPLEARPLGDGGGNHADVPRAAREGTNVVVLFIRENTDGASPFGELFLRRSTDAGVTFGGPVNLSSVLDPAAEVPADGQYDVVIDGANVCVVFGTTDNQLYQVRSVNGGGSFSEPVLLADRYFNQGNPAGVTIPRLAQESNASSKLHLFWGGAWYSRSTDAGASWTSPVNLMIQYSGWLLAPKPMVAVDSSSGFHWAQCGYWNLSDNDDYDVLYRRFVQAAAPGGTFNFAAQFAQQNADNVRFDNLQIPRVPALDLTNALSVECWVKLNPATLNADIVVGQVPTITGLSHSFSLAVVEDGFGHRWFTAGVDPDAGNPTFVQDSQRLIQPGVWYHLAMTFDATLPADNLKLYLNGNLLGASTRTDALPTSSLPIIVSHFLDGAVDDLRFWDHALTAQEIRDRLAGPLAGGEPGLVAYYKFDGSWAESTGNGLPAVPMYQESFGAGADVLPYLQIEIAGQDVKLTWVTFASNYAPQFTGDLSSANWQPVSGTPQLVDGRYTLTLPKSAGPTFFRLAR
jgi:hypothetical protein